MVTIMLFQRSPFTGLPTKDVKFCIHKKFICYHSPFFAAAFNGPFIEGETQTMKLDDVDAKTFGIFTNWLYTQDLMDGSGEYLIDIADLSQLWILAQRFLMPRMQNQVMRVLHSALKRCSDTLLLMELGRLARKHGSDTLKSLFLDKLAAMQCQVTFKNLTGSLEPDTLLELARLMKANQIGGVTEMKPVKEYIVPVEVVAEK